ncbi:IS4 family transposase [Nostoc sphaeroides CHAB 2801]|uniref:IS4 family transposase n=1 Tax=Nostoc sphaeroides TaxID=446679 RepID=UPI001E4EADA9|nr:IS4 family transposase [Nostoc sphaeroides]MCC5633103.1 IS4 family transposase [Nostoc sphaeroides CHAB 2801]
MTAETVAEYDVVLCVGDTSFLDYGSIEAKKEGYGPIGKGGNGLILHSALAIEPEKGQSIGLLWQKLWNREPKQKPPQNETPAKKKIRLAAARKEARKRPFEEKESYRWVEALTTVESLVSKHTRAVHIFDREGDITEVFEQVRQLQHTGVLVRAAHNRSLDSDSERLWSKMEAQPISLEKEIELPKTCKRSARKAKLSVRFCPVNLRTPYRFDNRDPLLVYAVYATEVDCPEGETPVEWMLLTTEVVADIQTASTILRWYSYRWRVEEYHKIFKSGCQVERYRLAANGMKALVGFLSVIAVELLQLTYLHRTQPTADAIIVLNPLQLRILKAKSLKLPKILTVSWAVEAIARLGGYLEHRHKTPIGIQVLWRGWLKLHDLCQGWQLAKET